jgi:hypothetical protein
MQRNVDFPFIPSGGGFSAGVKLPPIYETAFAHAGPLDGKVSLQALNRVLSLGGSSPYMVEKVGSRP